MKAAEENAEDHRGGRRRGSEEDDRGRGRDRENEV